MKAISEGGNQRRQTDTLRSKGHEWRRQNWVYEASQRGTRHLNVRRPPVKEKKWRRPDSARRWEGHKKMKRENTWGRQVDERRQNFGWDKWNTTLRKETSEEETSQGHKIGTGLKLRREIMRMGVSWLSPRWVFGCVRVTTLLSCPNLPPHLNPQGPILYRNTTPRHMLFGID